MRKHFIDILKDHKIDIKKEYHTLFRMIYFDEELEFKGEYSYYNDVDECFCSIWFRGTAISLEDFESKYDINFLEYPSDFDIDDFIFFCEFWYNMSLAVRSELRHNYTRYSPNFIIEQIDNIIEKIYYKIIYKEDIAVFIPLNLEAIEAAEIVEEYSFEILFYNHHSLKGDLKKKRELLIKFSDYLEPKRSILRNINKKFESDLFQLLNKMNIRHNNIDKNDKGNYIPFVSKMKPSELEHWYDEIYQMYLLAVLKLKHFDRSEKLEILINNINVKA